MDSYTLKSVADLPAPFRACFNFRFFFTFLLGLVLLTMASHLSADVNIPLLPVKYWPRGSYGCLKWSSDHHDILSVLPDNSTSHCSTSARLRSVAPYTFDSEENVEAMSLDPPSPVLVIIGAAVRYNLKVIRENKAQVVTLPSPHHQWSSSNSSVAHVDSMTGLTNALSLGATNVKVEDTRVTGHIQVSSLNVVLPDSLSLYMTPLSASFDPVQGFKAIPSMPRWFGVSGRQYLVQMKVFSQGPDAHEIYITENDDLKLSKTHSDYWQIFPISDDIAVKHSWQNSVVLKATSQGQGKLTASLTYFSGVNETKEVLKVVQEIAISDQVKRAHLAEFKEAPFDFMGFIFGIIGNLLASFLLMLGKRLWNYFDADAGAGADAGADPENPPDDEDLPG